jgi:multiple sugar transport system ATP-binding protein
MNIFPVELTRAKNKLEAKLPDGNKISIAHDTLVSGEYDLGIRPEAVSITSEGADCKAIVRVVERLGDRTLVYAELTDGSQIIAQDLGTSTIVVGDRVHLAFDSRRIHLFNKNGINVLLP